jgi:hypothetical protein
MKTEKMVSEEQRRVHIGVKYLVHTFLSTFAGAATAFAVGTAVFAPGLAIGFAGGPALAFAVFLSDLDPFGIVEEGDGLGEGRGRALGSDRPNFRSAKLQLFLLAAQEPNSRDSKSLVGLIYVNRSKI